MSRREFLAGSAAATAALAGWSPSLDRDPIRVGLVGCGGRGTGAAEDCLSAAEDVHLVAMADLFADRLARSREYLAGLHHDGFRVDDAHCFTGFDAYRRLLDADVDLVLLATPPGFRPVHFEAAIDAGKHVFFEKPVAVDPVGVRRVITVGERARERGLAVVAGTQYRHHPKFIETIRRIRDGQIGPVRAARAFYFTGGLWKVDRAEGMNDMEWQVRNWYYFDWLCGDHIVEQHVHTIDVTNWALGGHPVRASAVGGRQVRTDPVYGNIYDHFAVDYEYEGGVHVLSTCRQWEGTPGHVGAYFVGARGEARPYQGEIAGDDPWRYTDPEPNPYVLEHRDLIESIRAGRPLNEARQVAESTLTAILGREAAYTGRVLTWDEVLNSDQDYSPPRYEFGALPIRPVPLPGRS